MEAKTKETAVVVLNDNGETPIKSEINLYQGASLLKITDKEQKDLTASFPENEIEIRPDGLIYLPQTFWRKRLNGSFGIGQWCLIVKGNHKDPTPQKDKLYLQGVMMVRGSYISEAVGEAELHSNNPLQSWASVWESAKSDCITRCCKDLGIASELWQPEFIKAWIKKYAVQVWREKTGKKKDGTPGSFQWRKKTSEPFWDEKGQKQSKENTPKKETPNETPNETPDKKEITKEQSEDNLDVAIGRINELKTSKEVEEKSKEIRKYAISKGLTQKHYEYLTDYITKLFNKFKEKENGKNKGNADTTAR